MAERTTAEKNIDTYAILNADESGKSRGINLLINKV